MKRKIKRKSSLYQYLDSTGVLEKGTDAEITEARKTYWRTYKRQWKKEKRKSEKPFTVFFSIDEAKELEIAAKKHKMSPTRYIKRTTLVYGNRIYIVPNEIEVRRISQLLAMNYNIMQKMIDEDRIAQTTGRELLNKMSELEREVLVSLHNPKTLEEWVSEAIIKSSEMKVRIQKMLMT